MQTYTWYTDKPDLNSPGTIHQILAYGSLTAIKELLKIKGANTLKAIFLDKPQKVYTAPTFNFITKYILNLEGPIDESRYLKTTPRNIG